MEEEIKTEEKVMTPSEPHEPVKETKFSFRKWPILVIALLFLIILAMGGYIFLSNKQPVTPNSQTSVNTKHPLATQVLSTTPTPMPTKTFTSAKFDSLSFKGYSLNYPSDWTLSEQRDNSVPMSTVTLSKQGYTLKIFQAATGGAQCVYEGAMPEGPASDYRTSKFVDLESFATLRQTESPANGKMAYVYCQKNTSDGSFGQPTSVGHMSVTTGVAAADPTILSEIEDIVKSIKTL